MLLCRENEPGWDIEIRDDVIEECRKHGGVIHIYVDKNSAQVSDNFYNMAIKKFEDHFECFFFRNKFLIVRVCG